jgi:uncharacterized membrane protein
MDFIRRSGGQLALLILAVLGVAISIYLTSVHYENVPLVCSTSGLIDCSRVLSSTYSVVPGTSIPITIPGLLWFIVMGALALAALRVWPQRQALRIGEFIWSLLGLLTAFYLVFVELVRLHTICAWCTGVHAILLVSFIICALLLYQGEPETEFDEDEAEEQPSISVMRK